MKTIFLLIAAAAALSASPASAQNVYRCGNEYTRVPCKEGRAIETQNSATARERAEADRNAARERRLADQMERDRLRAERAHPPAGPANIGPAKAAAPPPAASAKLKPKKKTRAKIRVESDDGFTARVPRAAKQ